MVKKTNLDNNLNIRVRSTLLAEINLYAKKCGLTSSNFIRQAIEEKIERIIRKELKEKVEREL